MGNQLNRSAMLNKIEEIHRQLSKQAPDKYRINEIIPFGYPYRRVKVTIQANKSPEEAIQQIYNTLIQSIMLGFNTNEAICQFLGLESNDFLLNELYNLREKRYLDLVSNKWAVTPLGEDFVEDNSILQLLEEEDFEFLIDGLNHDILPKYEKPFSKIEDKRINFELSIGNRSPELLKGKFEQLAEAYKTFHNNKSLLVSIDETDILFDKKSYQDYYLIEYLPTESNENIEPFIEIRNTDEHYTKNKRLTSLLSEKYPNIIYQFSDSERDIAIDIKPHNLKDNSSEKELAHKTLSIWETQREFEKAITATQKALLIESPWIRRATLNYLNHLEKAAKRGVIIVILYGIAEKDDHHQRAIREMYRLDANFENFHLIHLPTHFEDNPVRNLTGTHRKLLIKDADFYLSGSFNFLSFNRKEGQTIANEETLQIRKGVLKKWGSVFEEYELFENILNDIIANLSS